MAEATYQCCPSKELHTLARQAAQQHVTRLPWQYQSATRLPRTFCVRGSFFDLPIVQRHL